jgi:hypothetical protein
MSTRPAPMLSAYEFTTRDGFLACRVEARTAADAAERARELTGLGGLLCTHLSDRYRGGVDAVFSYGPDAVD